MSDPVANATLELACTVGSMSDAIEAIIDDGADVDYNGGAPLFIAIIARDRRMINLLLDHGADVSLLLTAAKLKPLKTRFLLVEALIACAPYSPNDVKPDQIQEFDGRIRTEGIDRLLEADWENITSFRDSLNAIGAGNTHRCVSDFLQWAQTDEGIQQDSLDEFLSANNDKISEYREQYLTAEEDLIALANDYVKSDDDDTSSEEV